VSIVTLLDVVTNLDTYDQEFTIYAAEPWSPASATIVAMEPDDGSVPREAAALGATDFGEVFVANEFLEGWKANVKPDASATERCERLIQHAAHCGLSGKADPEVWAHAFANDQVVVTLNAGDFLTLAAGGDLHPGLIVLRESGLTRDEQWSRLEPGVTHIEGLGGDLKELSAAGGQ
jgi:predicted nuclease of predicted toxin-antitoxin system